MHRRSTFEKNACIPRDLSQYSKEQNHVTLTWVNAFLSVWIKTIFGENENMRWPYFVGDGELIQLSLIAARPDRVILIQTPTKKLDHRPPLATYLQNKSSEKMSFYHAQLKVKRAIKSTICFTVAEFNAMRRKTKVFFLFAIFWTSHSIVLIHFSSFTA